MRRFSLFLSLLLGVLVVGLLPAFALGDKGGVPNSHSGKPRLTHPSAVLTATLSGANVVSAHHKKGDAGGSGKATLTIKANSRRLCYSFTDLHFSKAGDRPLQAKVHFGVAGKRGGVAAVLVRTRGGFTKGTATPATYSATACHRVSEVFLRRVTRNPSKFYVQVRTKRFPLGAIRGQLTASTTG